MTVEPTTKDKQITIDVPEDRVAEFYAFYGHFLAGTRGRRGRGRGHGPHGRRCGPHRHEEHAEHGAERGAPTERPGPEATVV
jgi:hypothetical protein